MMGRGLQRHCALRPRATRLRESGYSLVEMVVTVAVILVITGIAIPLVMNVTAAYRLRSAVAAVTGTIQSTRYQAIYQGYSYQVVFDSTAKTYQVQSKPPCASPCVATYSNVGNAAIWSESAGAVTLDANATLTFGPGGKVSNNGGAQCNPCQLTLTYPGKPAEVISVSGYGNINVTP
jgi:type IV fimbrial biogenesis protein FimT